MVKIRGAVAVVVAVGLLAGCSEQESAPVPGCDGDTAVLVAESVPGASLVPCFTEVPAGWSHSGVLISDAGTRVEFNSDRAGDDAAVLQFQDSCDVGEAVTLPAREDGVDRFERIMEVSPSFRSDRYLVFDGGCVEWQFHFSPGSPASLSVELSVALQLLERSEIEERLAELAARGSPEEG